MDIKRLQFMMNGDERGQLIALEENREIPFTMKRVYYIFDTRKDVVRGMHAHISLQQVLVCVHGSCKITLDDGKERETVTLDDPSEGIYISNLVWRELFDFSEDAVLMVIASEIYDESDYIRDYDSFLKRVSSK